MTYSNHRFEDDMDAGLTPVRVDQRWDRYTRSWVTTLVTESDEQVGDAAYDGNRADAAASKAQYERVLAELTQPQLVATGDFRRGGDVQLSDGRTGHVVGYDGPDRVKVQVMGSGAAERPIVTAERSRPF